MNDVTSAFTPLDPELAGAGDVAGQRRGRRTASGLAAAGAWREKCAYSRNTIIGWRQLRASDQSSSSGRQLPTRRSMTEFIRGAWTARAGCPWHPCTQSSQSRKYLRIRSSRGGAGIGLAVRFVASSQASSAVDDGHLQLIGLDLSPFVLAPCSLECHGMARENRIPSSRKADTAGF